MIHSPIKQASFEQGLACQENLISDSSDHSWREVADSIVAGYVPFSYEAEPIYVGLRNIDWSGGHRNHNQWVAQLNRFFFLTQLAIAYRETKDEVYASTARNYIDDWIDHATYSSALCLSIRVGSSHHTGWCGTLPIFAESEAFDSEFIAKMFTSVTEQLTWLLDNMTPLGNMRVSEFDALLMTALRHPQLKSAATFREIGERGLRNVLRGQFLADGAHYEMAPSYAFWMARVLADYAWLQTVLPEIELGISETHVANALSYITHGMDFPANDCWRPDHSLSEQIATNQRLLKRLNGDLSETWTPPYDQVFDKAGQVFLRNGWSEADASLSLDASSWGSTHTHASRLALHFSSGARELIVDPGILDYEMSNPLAAYGKSTAAHSTLNLNDLNQGQAGAHLLRTDINDRCALIHARYDASYWDGPLTWSFREGCGQGTHGIHDRLVFWVRDEYLLVMDVLVASPGNTINNTWQLGECDAINLREDDYVVQTKHGDTNLHLQLVAVPEGASMSCASGQMNPPRGWVGHTYNGGGQSAAPHVTFSYPSGVPAGGISAVLAMPYSTGEAPSLKIEKQCTGPGGIAKMLVLDFGDGRRDTIAWTPQLANAIELGEDAQSDSPFFWLRQTDYNAPHEGYLLDGSYVLVPSAAKEELKLKPGHWKTT